MRKSWPDVAASGQLAIQERASDSIARGPQYAEVSSTQISVDTKSSSTSSERISGVAIAPPQIQFKWPPGELSF